jgi:hypothetical protein
LAASDKTEILNMLLFDVDGVIVNPLAYRVGVKMSIELLCKRAGITNAGALVPDESDIAFFESCGVHDTWDMTNIFFCAILMQLISFETIFAPSGDTAEKAIAELATVPRTVPRPDYKKLAGSLRTEPVSHPPDTALSIFKSELQKRPNSEQWIKLIENFLGSTRSIYDSVATRLYQNVVLGTKDFSSTYGLASEHDGECLLLSADKVLISKESVAKLVSMQGDGAARVAIYTGRPSHPPESEQNKKGYSPEAELAIQFAEMERFPLVAMGKMQWLAERHGERLEDLTKPNTTQACAAIMACITGRDDDSILESAFDVTKKDVKPDDSFLNELKNRDVRIFVFEDTTSGIAPMLRLADELNSQGYKLSVHALGIASDDSKKASLKKYCDAVFASVNEAIDYAVSAYIDPK